MFSTTRPDKDRNQDLLAAEIERRVAAHPELASDVEILLVDGSYVVVLGEALRARLNTVLTEEDPSRQRGN